LKNANMDQPCRVVAVLPRQACLFELGIATELFGLPRPELGMPWYRFRTIAGYPDGSRALGGVSLGTGSGPAGLRQADLVVVPGWSTDPTPPPAPLLRELRRAHERGARFMTICSGAFLLGHAGLLDELPATTHWAYCDAFARLFPRVRLQPDVLYVEAGRILTSAGSAAGIDAGLHLIACDHGAVIANRVAQRLLVTPYRDGGQRQFVPSAYPQRSVDRFDDLLAWMQAHLHHPLTVATLARRAHMSERNFLRRFAQATGSTPKAWLQRLRIARARELYETTPLDLQAISSACGFGSPETFRAAFRREVGVSASTYRQRFGAVGAAHRDTG
jgi:AraC family transcriptional activator FtrA